MSKTTRGILAFLALCGLSFLLVNCGSTVNRSSGLLYVLIQGTNQISSYAINLTSGNLSLINSNASTCNTTTAPTCGLPEDISLDPQGATAFVSNQGLYTPPNLSANPPTDSNGIAPSIYGYTVNSDGSLAIKGDLTTSGTQTPPPPCDLPYPAQTTHGPFYECDLVVAMARDSSGKFLFVITAGNQGLTTLADPTPNPDPLGAPNLPPLLYVFATQPGSPALTLTGTKCPSPTTTPPPCPLSRIPTGLAVINDPVVSGNLILYVTSSKDLKVGENVDNTLSEYSVDGSGNLIEHVDPNTGFPYPTPGTPNAVLAVQTAPVGGTSGLFAYVASATTNGVSGFQLCTVITSVCTSQDVQDYRLVSVGTPSTAGSNPVAMVADPTKSFLYVVSKNSSQIFGFRINATQGTLTALSPANLNTGVNPIAIAMHSSGQFVFVSNNGSANLSSYVLNTTSGSMSSPITITSLGNPAGLVSK